MLPRARPRGSCVDGYFFRFAVFFFGAAAFAAAFISATTVRVSARIADIAFSQIWASCRPKGAEIKAAEKVIFTMQPRLGLGRVISE